MLHSLSVVPLWVVTLLFAGIVIASVRLGVWSRRFVGNDPATIASGQLVSGTASVLSLLVGFTFGMALSRFDERRDLVLEESNAIRSMNRAIVHFEASDRAKIAESLLLYTKGRIDFVRANLIDQQDMVPRMVAEREALNRVVANVDPVSKAGVNQSEILGYATRVLDAGTRLDMLLAAHVPPRVILVLLILSIGSAVVIGISIGDRWRSVLLPLTIWSMMLSIALFTIVDLDSTQWGSIRLDSAPLDNALKAIQAAR
jgi:hypothetical protein